MRTRQHHRTVGGHTDNLTLRSAGVIQHRIESHRYILLLRASFKFVDISIGRNSR